MKEGARLIPVSEATVVASSSTFVKETEPAAEILVAVDAIGIGNGGVVALVAFVIKHKA